MNTAPVRDQVKRRNRSMPALEIALSMLTRKRLPVPLMTGVWRAGAQERPAAASERLPDRLPSPQKPWQAELVGVASRTSATTSSCCG
jgi:hypothetical protein